MLLLSKPRWQAVRFGGHTGPCRQATARVDMPGGVGSQAPFSTSRVRVSRLAHDRVPTAPGHQFNMPCRRQAAPPPMVCLCAAAVAAPPCLVPQAKLLSPRRRPPTQPRRAGTRAVREHGLRTQAAPRTGSAFSEPRKARPLAAPDGQTGPRWTWVGGDGGAAQGQQPAGQDQSLEWREPNIYATRHGFSKVASIAHPAVRP